MEVEAEDQMEDKTEHRMEVETEHRMEDETEDRMEDERLNKRIWVTVNHGIIQSQNPTIASTHTILNHQ